VSAFISSLFFRPAGKIRRRSPITPHHITPHHYKPKARFTSPIISSASLPSLTTSIYILLLLLIFYLYLITCFIQNISLNIQNYKLCYNFSK
jgi:hypothetical protein